ncbi:DUF3833 domain-containing protein [Fertoebacter nigrum]|uniref:DUF3833 domain-containing protein n=1 Tax=Fertoeibacter niger TaxID=2656921 RepID=A0A8X8KPI5_9RHOB|nr:DUF3833 domain-containing protein [Fertoeibacter niger]
MLMLLSGFVLALALVAAKARFLGFRSQKPADFAGKGPVFDLRQHLNGPILCEGVIYGPTGRVTSRFVADMQGSWDGNTGTLAETFRYDSGTVQERCWTLRLGRDGAISAEAPDVVGEGQGQVIGPAVRLRYRIRLAQDAGGHVLDVTDWMYLMDNGTIMNRSQFTKFGITVAELVATLRRVET